MPGAQCAGSDFVRVYLTDLNNRDLAEQASAGIRSLLKECDDSALAPCIRQILAGLQDCPATAFVARCRLAKQGMQRASMDRISLPWDWVAQQIAKQLASELHEHNVPPLADLASTAISSALEQEPQPVNRGTTDNNLLDVLFQPWLKAAVDLQRLPRCAHAAGEVLTAAFHALAGRVASNKVPLTSIIKRLLSMLLHGHLSVRVASNFKALEAGLLQLQSIQSVPLKLTQMVLQLLVSAMQGKIPWQALHAAVLAGSAFFMLLPDEAALQPGQMHAGQTAKLAGVLHEYLPGLVAAVQQKQSHRIERLRVSANQLMRALEALYPLAVKACKPQTGGRGGTGRQSARKGPWLHVSTKDEAQREASTQYGAILDPHNSEAGQLEASAARKSGVHSCKETGCFSAYRPGKSLSRSNRDFGIKLFVPAGPSEADQERHSPVAHARPVLLAPPAARLAAPLHLAHATQDAIMHAAPASDPTSSLPFNGPASVAQATGGPGSPGCNGAAASNGLRYAAHAESVSSIRISIDAFPSSPASWHSSKNHANAGSHGPQLARSRAHHLQTHNDLLPSPDRQASPTGVQPAPVRPQPGHVGAPDRKVAAARVCENPDACEGRRGATWTDAAPQRPSPDDDHDAVVRTLTELMFSEDHAAPTSQCAATVAAAHAQPCWQPQVNGALNGGLQPWRVALMHAGCADERSAGGDQLWSSEGPVKSFLLSYEPPDEAARGAEQQRWPYTVSDSASRPMHTQQQLRRESPPSKDAARHADGEHWPAVMGQAAHGTGYPAAAACGGGELSVCGAPEIGAHSNDGPEAGGDHGPAHVAVAGQNYGFKGPSASAAHPEHLNREGSSLQQPDERRLHEGQLRAQSVPCDGQQQALKMAGATCSMAPVRATTYSGGSTACTERQSERGARHGAGDSYVPPVPGTSWGRGCAEAGSQRVSGELFGSGAAGDGTHVHVGMVTNFGAAERSGSLTRSGADADAIPCTVQRGVAEVSPMAGACSTLGREGCTHDHVGRDVPAAGCAARASPTAARRDRQGCGVSRPQLATSPASDSGQPRSPPGRSADIASPSTVCYGSTASCSRPASPALPAREPVDQPGATDLDSARPAPHTAIALEAWRTCSHRAVADSLHDTQRRLRMALLHAQQALATCAADAILARQSKHIWEQAQAGWLPHSASLDPGTASPEAPTVHSVTSCSSGDRSMHQPEGSPSCSPRHTQLPLASSLDARPPHKHSCSPTPAVCSTNSSARSCASLPLNALAALAANPPPATQQCSSRVSSFHCEPEQPAAMARTKQAAPGEAAADGVVISGVELQGAHRAPGQTPAEPPADLADDAAGVKCTVTRRSTSAALPQQPGSIDGCVATAGVAAPAHQQDGNACRHKWLPAVHEAVFTGPPEADGVNADSAGPMRTVSTGKVDEPRSSSVRGCDAEGAGAVPPPAPAAEQRARRQHALGASRPAPRMASYLTIIASGSLLSPMGRRAPGV